MIAPHAWVRGTPTLVTGLILGLVPTVIALPRAPGQDTGATFLPDQAIYSRVSGPELPEEPPAGAEELAPALGLVEDGERNGNPIWRHQQTGMPFVFVPGGTFTMGSDHRDLFQHKQVTQSAQRAGLGPEHFFREQPMTEVYVSPFFIGMYEVTVAEYRPFLEQAEAGGVEEFEFPLFPRKVPHTPYLWGEDIQFWGDRQPIVGISWLSAYAFCNWMGGRLPTEAEWEKAARGADGRVWPWGNHFSTMRANIVSSQNDRTLPVGMYEGGRSPYGCYNMAGNAQEYCLDSFELSIYRHRRMKDHCLLERAPSEPYRVLRGGSWITMVYRARTTDRDRIRIDRPFQAASNPVEGLNTGFRVVLSTQTDLYPEGFLERFRPKKQKPDDSPPEAPQPDPPNEDDGN